MIEKSSIIAIGIEISVFPKHFATRVQVVKSGYEAWMNDLTAEADFPTVWQMILYNAIFEKL